MLHRICNGEGGRARNTMHTMNENSMTFSLFLYYRTDMLYILQQRLCFFIGQLQIMIFDILKFLFWHSFKAYGYHSSNFIAFYILHVHRCITIPQNQISFPLFPLIHDDIGRVIRRHFFHWVRFRMRIIYQNTLYIIILREYSFNKIMNSDSDSEGEGFYKPKIQISDTKPIYTEEIIRVEQEMEQANTITMEERPTDYKPRFLSTSITYHHYQANLDSRICCQGQIMQEISYRKDKTQRFSSLKDKYLNNPDYQQVYSKKYKNQEFSTYIFSLQNTTDYNPSDYSKPIVKEQRVQSVFDSRFQCGNLLYAFRCLKKQSQIQQQYDLIMQNDTNTKGYNQWFYFSYKNRSTKSVRINIVNFIKKHLMFLDGVRPVGFSLKAHQNQKKGWSFVGNNILYQKSYVTRQIQGNPPTFKNYYTLTFDFDFQYGNDTVYFALNFPYSYSRMINHLDQVMKQADPSLYIQKNILCHSISNNPIPYIKVKHKENYSKSVIVCLGRQHPGQTVGSFVLQSFINSIIKNEQLLKKHEFLIVPMVNPDGVIYGNFRTNLAGFDLNRQWIQPNRWLHPQVYFVSKLINAQSNVVFCMDFHGHSKKLNSFTYGCVDENIHNFRLYPYIFSKQCKLFTIEDCTSNITFDKMRTARVNLFKFLKIPHIYTLQTGFYGHTKNNKKTRYTFQDFVTLGNGAASALNTLFLKKSQVKKYQQQVKQKSFLFDQWAVRNKQDYGSQSNPSQDQLNPVQRKAKVMSQAKIMQKQKKKKKKSPKKKVRKIKEQSLKFIKKKQSQSFLSNFSAEKEKASEKKETDNSVIILYNKQKPLKKEVKSTYLEPKIKPPLPPPIKPKAIKTNGIKKKEQQVQMQGTKSNLLNNHNFFKMKEDLELEKGKTQEKLQIVTLKPEKPKVENKSRLINRQKKSVSVPHDVPTYSRPKRKSRQRVYVIKQHKVINSITRNNEDDVKKQIQRQISNRTAVLKNCQKIMSNLSVESKTEKVRSFEEDPYKTKKLLQPLDIQRHRNFRNAEQESRGVFFSFI